jgi:hypothetical protein
MNNLNSIKLAYRLDQLISNFKKENLKSFLLHSLNKQLILPHSYVIWNSDLQSFPSQNTKNTINEHLCIVFAIEYATPHLSLTNNFSNSSMSIYVYNENNYATCFPFNSNINSYYNLISKSLRII